MKKGKGKFEGEGKEEGEGTTALRTQSTVMGHSPGVLISVCLTVALVAPAAASARTLQARAANTGNGVQADTELQRIDSLVAAGLLNDARGALDQWQARNPAGSPTRTELRAHALFLRGLLAGDWAAAEEAYLGVSLSYPTSRDAPDALLRLAQGLLAAASTGRTPNATARAIGYLARLKADYPAAGNRAAASLWLARAHRSTGDRAAACAAAQDAERIRTDDETAAEIRTEQSLACNRMSAQASQRVSTPLPRGPTGAGEFAVQIAALRSRERAEQLAAQLSRLGFQARVVTTGASPLHRVRVGSLDQIDDARALAQRLRAAGFEAVIVDDVKRERSPR
jgi:cell division septation protein DedD